MRKSSLFSSQSIHWYLQDLATVPELSLKAEHDLLQQIAADPLSPKANDARQRLIEGNLRLVVRFAHRYQSFGLELADLIQEGNLALVRAAQEFDPKRSQHFRPFAARRICWAFAQMVKKHLRERYLLEPEREMPRPLRSQILKALAHDAIDEQALPCDLPEARVVSLDILLNAMDTDEVSTDDHSYRHLSCSNDEMPDEAWLAQERRCCLAGCLQDLVPQERLVLVYRYLLDVAASLEKVGEALHVSRERVRQLEAQGIQNMRHPRISRKLRRLL